MQETVPHRLRDDAGLLIPPWRARKDERAFDFQLASRETARQKVFELRQRVYAGRSEYLLDIAEGLHPAEDRFDSASLLFLCRDEGREVAACRFTPRGAQGFEATDLCARPRLPEVDPTLLLQVGRVVLCSTVRRHAYGEAMMLLCCRFLLEHSSFTHYFAVCTPALARFYKHFGVEILSPDPVRLSGRPRNSYLFVHGTFAHSADTLGTYLARTGWTFETPAPQNPQRLDRAPPQHAAGLNDRSPQTTRRTTWRTS